MKSRYILQKTDHSYCSVCHKNLDLLTKTWTKGVMFYICWSCQRIWEVGRGPVDRSEA